MAQEQRKRRLLWVAGTVAAAGAGAYLLYRAWREAERKKQVPQETRASSPTQSAQHHSPTSSGAGRAGNCAGSPGPAPADVMVQSMLSQEALLTPLKLRESHYTRLLSEHAAQGHIAEEEIKVYRQQYGIVQELTRLLELEPDNTPRLLHLMQLLQESGDPPPDPSSDPRLSLSPPPPP